MKRSKKKKKNKVKGFTCHLVRPKCGDCKYLKYSNKKGQKETHITFCKKVKPKFMVYLDDICSEFTKTNNK